MEMKQNTKDASLKIFPEPFFCYFFLCRKEHVLKTIYHMEIYREEEWNEKTNESNKTNTMIMLKAKSLVKIFFNFKK